MKVGMVLQEPTFFVGSGIYTFVKHYSTLLNELGIQCDIISPIVDPSPKYIEALETLSNVKLYYPASDAPGIYQLVNSVHRYVKYEQPDIVILNNQDDYLSCVPALRRARKVYVYDHCSQSFFNNYEPTAMKMKDTTNKVNMEILVPNKRMQEIYKERYDIDAIFVHHPFYAEYTEQKQREGVCIVSSSYPRKKIPEMLSHFVNTCIPVNFFGKWDEKNNGTGWELKVQLTKNLVPVDEIVDNIKNNRIQLQLATQEMCPYSCLEASLLMPVVVSSKPEWTKGLPYPVVHVDPNDTESILKIYNNYSDYPLLDFDEYKKNMYKDWRMILKCE